MANPENERKGWKDKEKTSESTLNIGLTDEEWRESRRYVEEMFAAVHKHPFIGKESEKT